MPGKRLGHGVSTPGIDSDVDIYSIELKLSDAGDESLREQLSSIPTAVHLSEAQLYLLRAAARSSLAGSSEFQPLKRWISADAAGRQ